LNSLIDKKEAEWLIDNVCLLFNSWKEFGFFLNGRLHGRQGAREHKDVKFISLSI